MSANNSYTLQKRLLFKKDGLCLQNSSVGGEIGGGGGEGKIGSESTSFTTVKLFQMIMDQPGLWVYRIRNI